MSKKLFDLKKEIDLYTAWIVHDVRSPKKRKQIRNEYANHLEDAIYQHMLRGYTEEEAFRVASHELGDSKKIQRLLSIVHNKDPFKHTYRLVIITLIIFSAYMSHIIPHTDWPYTLQSWLIFLFQLVSASALVIFFVHEYKFFRAWGKRILLIHKVKSICKSKNYACHCTMTAYTHLDNLSDTPPILIQTGEKAITIRFIACLNRKDTYTFTDINNYYTSNNFNPILVSFRHPSSGLTPTTADEKKLYLPWMMVSQNVYLKEEILRPEINHRCDHDTVNILCLHPISVKVQVVRTNHAENIFDGDTFKKHIVYSGNGLCKYLTNL